MKRVIRPGGRLHVLAEDYGMIHMPSGGIDIDHFWHKGVIAYGDDIGTDLRIGRKIYRLLRQLDLCEIEVNYVTVDTCKVDRNIFAGQDNPQGGAPSSGADYGHPIRQRAVASCNRFSPPRVIKPVLFQLNLGGRASTPILTLPRKTGGHNSKWSVRVDLKSSASASAGQGVS